MRAIRVATIINGDPNREQEQPRIRLELVRVEKPADKNDRYKWINATYPEERVEQPKFRTVAEAMRALYAWYNVPGWGLKTSDTDNTQIGW